MNRPVVTLTRDSLIQTLASLVCLHPVITVIGDALIHSLESLADSRPVVTVTRGASLARATPGALGLLKNVFRGPARVLAGESGQATSESAVLLVTAVLTAFGGGVYLLSSHPAWLNALNIHIHGFYYLLSLPFP